jgi:hypothetical protein
LKFGGNSERDEIGRHQKSGQLSGVKAGSMLKGARLQAHIRDLKALLFVVISVGVLTAGFYSNTWKAAPDRLFAKFEATSESLVIGRILKSRRDGLLSSGALPGWVDYPRGDRYREATRHQFETYYSGNEFRTFHTYKSQPGGQTFLFSLLDSAIPLREKRKLEFFRFTTASVNGIILSLVILWFYRQFGPLVAGSVLFCVAYSMWLTLFGRNPWWILGVFYVPMLSMMLLLQDNSIKQKCSKRIIGLSVFVVMILKCFLNGYEFLTTTIIMMMCPFIYYCIKDNWGAKVLFQRLFVVMVASLAAILTILAIILGQIAASEGSILKGLHHIYYRIIKRTYYFDDTAEVNVGHTVDLLEVLGEYAGSILLTFEHALGSSSPITRLFILDASNLTIALLVATLALISASPKRIVGGKQRRKVIGLLATAWFSLLAPLSWILIFKSHSAAHLHMNHVIWHMPSALFAFAVFGFLADQLLHGFRAGHGSDTGRDHS